MYKNKPDQTDISILNLLQRDGLMTYKEIAGKIKKSMTLVVERIRALRDNGYIINTVALVDVHKLCSLFVAFPHVRLTSHSEEVLKQFAEHMRNHPEVMECYHITGHFDFMLKIVMPDMPSYNLFLREKLNALPYVGSIQSFLVLSEDKYSTAYPL
ncbi:Lrp/AsnC family transcriptional regulator [Pedobacter mucosus]|uniref:Lrp/AsnC family transcriptional regulator n=1 Tax=Pedobacter mucosus TaxID=2895286 RepID=UPI001EE4A881|nr:Lrp/AsnC family transcriptional regulator [Pedobacter mucosus]UKT64989.1 Lrp/AsnC family transcriptional regulator [Pedobacter mucosus]